MPRYLKQDGKRVSNIKKEYAWIVIPVKSDTSITSTSLNTETYLVQTRVADYIEKLERKLKGNIPILSKNKKYDK